MVGSSDQGPPDHLTKDHLTKDHLTILVVKLSDIGDVLTATPALRALRESFPAARLEALVPPNSAPVLAESPLVDDVIVFDKFQYDRPIDAFKPSSLAALVRFARDLRRRRYDCLVILHHLTTRWGTLKYAALALTSGAKVRAGLDNGRGWFLTHRVRDHGFGARHEVEYWLDVVGTIGARTEDTSLEMTIGAEDEAFANDQIPPFLSPPTRGGRGGCPLVAIHPGSGGYSLARRWSAEGFAQVADALVERYGARIVLVGTSADGVSQVASLMRSEAVNLEGKTTLGQLAAILKRCDLFIGADSGVMHLAAAVGTPLVAIFGPSNHRAWGPWPRDGRHIILRAELPCSPCSYVSYRVGQREGCQAMTCMKAITPEMVLAAAERVLLGNPDFQSPISNFRLPTSNLQPPASTILGVRTDNVNYDQALSLIEGFVVSGTSHQVVTVNPEFIVAAQSDDDFRRILNASSLALPDGVGLLWAARFLGHPLQKRVTGTDTVQRLAALAAQKGYSLFLLGAAPGVAVATAARLCETYPDLRIVGTHAGSPALEEEDEIVRLIQRAKPDILLVAYGAPAQDKWIARNLERLGVPVAMGVGGAFDFISGRAKRAPRWLQRLGLEWLHRLYRQPWRWRRMLSLPKFVWLVMWQRLAKR
ncbi:MAG: WecB/TagA/CpsF family glycosyltransferase [Anaerolineales bacterium]|nr:WecB/TagA/CpsF family glycosyltransferase [Anaerolineales bacterium]